MENPDLSPVTARMGELRRRIRHLFLLSGISRVLLGIALLLGLSFLLDVLLNLPMAVRIASAVIALAVLAAVVLRAVIYPLTVEIPMDDLALAAEARLPDLEDRLVSALQFRRQIEDPENPESREMMRAVIADAASLSRAIETSRLTDGRAVRKSGLLAGAGIAAFLAAVLLFPAAASVWARRNLLLRDLPWPRSTTMVVTGFPASGELVVTRGETVRIQAEARGRIPNDVKIAYERLDGAGTAYRPMFEVEGEPGRFRFEFRQVPESFRFWVVGGDDTDREPVYTVRALAAPTIQNIEAACTFPEYTGMPAHTYQEGDLDLPVGTSVDMRLELNMALASATVTRDTSPPEPVELREGGRQMHVRFLVDKTFDYRFDLTGQGGQKNLPDTARFRIRSVSDRKPQARILFPTERESFTEKASVPVKIFASDNYGVSKVSLYFRKGAEGAFVERPFTGKELSAPIGSREIIAYHMFPIAEFGGPEGGAKVGDEIYWFAEATDNNGNTDRTSQYRMEIVTSEALERKLNQRQGLLREDLTENTRDQTTARNQTRDLLDFVNRVGKLDPRDRERIRDDQVLQSRITRETGRFSDSVSRVFLAYVLNRLSTPLATERIIGFVDDFLRTDHEVLTNVFKPELFRRIIADYRAGNILDQEVLAVLIEILDISSGVETGMSPQAQQLLTGLARGEPSVGVKTDLAKTLSLQNRILESFAALDVKMQRWESYAEVIQLARRLRDLQRNIRTGTDTLKKEK